MECTPIGIVRTPFESTDEIPRQGFCENREGTVVLDAAYAPGLDGYEPGYEAVVVWFADEADRSVLTIDRDGGRGVFTTRSPARPNPVCLSACAVTSVDVDAGRLGVRGVDMLDGSPVLDLKPPIR